MVSILFAVTALDTGIDNATLIALLALVVATVFGIISVVQALRLEGLTTKTKDLTDRISEYQGDEKTAVLWRHAKNVKTNLKENQKYEMEEIKSNIRAAGRLEPYYSTEERAALRNAVNKLIENMRPEFLDDANEVESLFKSYFPS